MILSREGTKTLIADGWADVYVPITWCNAELEPRPSRLVDGKNVIAVWIAPLDETRWRLPAAVWRMVHQTGAVVRGAA